MLVATGSRILHSEFAILIFAIPWAEADRFWRYHSIANRPPMTTRPDLTALRIHRDDEDETRFPLGKVAGWIVALAAVGAIAWAGYTRFVVPRRAPVVESAVVKPSINVANPALLSATGYLVANKQSKITPKISGKVVRLNFDVGDKVHAGDVLAVLESTNLRAQ